MDGVTQDTIESLEGMSEALDKVLKGLKSENKIRQSSAKSTEELKKVFEDLEKQVNENNKRHEESTTLIEKGIEQKVNELKISKKMSNADIAMIKERGSVWKNTKLSLYEAPGKLSKGLNEGFAKKLGPMSGAFESLSSKVPIAGAAIAGLGMAVGATVGVLFNAVDTYSDLTKAGVGLKGSYSDLLLTSAGLNMSLDEFTGMAASHAKVFNMMGMKEIADSANAMGASMFEFGYTTKETGEYLADYLETQRLAGHLSKVDMITQSASARSLAKEAANLALAFGTTQDALLEGVQKAYDDPSIQRVMANMPNHVKNAFDKSIAYFNATVPELADSIQEIVGSSIPQATGAFQTAMGAGLSGVASSMLRYKEMMIAAGDDEQAQFNIRQGLVKELAAQDAERLQVLSDGGNQEAKIMLARVMQARLALKANQGLSNEEQFQRAKEATKIREAMQTFSALPNTIMGSVLKGLGDGNVEAGLKAFTTILNDAAQWIKDLFTDFDMEEIKTWFKDTKKAFKEFTWSGLFADIAVSIGAGLMALPSLIMEKTLNKIGEGINVDGLGTKVRDYFSTAINDFVFGIDDIINNDRKWESFGKMMDSSIESTFTPMLAVVDKMFGTDTLGFLKQLNFGEMIGTKVSNMFTAISEWLEENVYTWLRKLGLMDEKPEEKVDTNISSTNSNNLSNSTNPVEANDNPWYNPFGWGSDDDVAEINDKSKKVVVDEIKEANTAISLIKEENQANNAQQDGNSSINSNETNVGIVQGLENQNMTLAQIGDMLSRQMDKNNSINKEMVHAMRKLGSVTL